MPPPSSLATVYATDEDIVNIAGDDFQVLAGRWHKFAEGADGVFGTGDPWTLLSASNNFVAQGLQPNMIVQLTAPKSQFKGSGDLLAIETVNTGSLVLRRAGEATGIGQPPVPIAGLGSIAFLVTSLRRQIEDTAFQLNEQFAVDPNLPNRTPGDIYDIRIFRRLTVYQVVLKRYINMNRAAKGDFADKIDQYREAYQTELAGATIRWGAQGNTQESTGRFSTRLER